ncbi:hypothetical protein VTO42DRAFT_6759 [Malbranchea cinnamomea]
MATPGDQDELISHICTVTGVDADRARALLERNEWNLQEAVMSYYNDDDEPENNTAAQQEFDAFYERQLEAQRVAERTGVSGASGSGASKPSKAPKKKFATLGDLNSGAGGDESEDDDEHQDLFAGGEKSGLAVQNPDDIKKKIIEKAKRGVPSGEDSQPRRSYFTGPARTLGGDDTPSRIIEDPNANRPQPPPRVKRVLHFWDDGFSVDDGELYRSDDPVNAQILEGIRQGRAPLSIMNVQMGQEVDVEIQQHDGKYVKPKPKYKPFAGPGQRLGSPTPGVTSTASAPATTTPTAAPTPSGPVNSALDESLPTVTLQIRLGDGTRLTSRFNTAQTIGDVYDFVSRAIPANETRDWVLMTTFPSTELKDKNAALGDLKEFQRGGVMVQKWI